MRKIDAKEVASHLGIHPITLYCWYNWYRSPRYKKPADMPKLPAYLRNSRKGRIYWWDDDLPILEEFRDWVIKGRNGVMGRFNEQFWRKGKPNENKKTKESKEPICYNGVFSF